MHMQRTQPATGSIVSIYLFPCLAIDLIYLASLIYHNSTINNISIDSLITLLLPSYPLSISQGDEVLGTLRLKPNSRNVRDLDIEIDVDFQVLVMYRFGSIWTKIWTLFCLLLTLLVVPTANVNRANRNKCSE